MMFAPRSLVAALAFASVSAIAPAVSAQGPTVHSAARRLDGPITIDGHLDDVGWADVPIAHGFVQRFPDAGKAPEHDTSFRVAYDDHALYVAIRLDDDQPDKIRGLLTRRDQNSASDWAMVGIDSYHDRRTAFVFGVNPVNVQRDMILFDDSQQDESWDAVWSSASAIDAHGWSAELRIPLSQLRFASQDRAEWGFQIQRVVARTGEESVWSPWPRSVPQIVSSFGTLGGLDGLAPARRLEVLPYATGGGEFSEDVDDADPFAHTARARGNLGLDVRYGLTSAITLAATINPDFGQVEADPSQVNLSANELFFPEKRPFFLEGNDIFRYSIAQGDGGDATESLFYSRRIGAAPHGDPDGAYVDLPSSTAIYGAAKVSGKTQNGWSIGVLDAVTGEERARVDDGNGVRTRPIVEPLTNYAVGRLKKDFREGRTSVGGALTAVHRAVGGTGLESELRDQAYAAGTQIENRFGPDNVWQANLRIAGSWVHGSPDAIADTQTSIRHLYQRPDQDQLHYDPTRTSLSGAAAMYELGKFSGGHWGYGIGGDTRTPGFEVNDLGYQRNANYAVQWGFLQYRADEPTDHLLGWNVNLNLFGFSDLSPQLIGAGGNVNANATLASHWSLGGGVNIDGNRWDPHALRGGANLRDNPQGNLWLFVATDPRKAVAGNLNVNASRKPVNDTWSYGINAGVTIQARSNLDLFVGPMLNISEDDSQYIDEVADAAGAPHYIFGRIHQVVTGLTMRANWTFTPRLSLQAYAMPFVAAGAYSKLKEAADTHARAYDQRFSEFGAGQVSTMDDVVSVDRNGDGVADFAFDKPDFDVRQLNSTLVLRWEYRPGSAAFLIWSHSRDDSTTDGQFRLGTDLGALGTAPGEHVVMIKVNYWIGL
ncbi:MAG: carbohydrate binding family 9 domain-containing protein [Deltaproteobacteria bacterium]|nr:carbohydrate binding family 9 domain-containing protein [Deltaproteobacteria bacterium]